MFQIIVDSAANIPAELVKKYKIKVLSFINFVNGKEVTCFDPELSPEEERQKGHECRAPGCRCKDRSDQHCHI